MRSDRLNSPAAASFNAAIATIGFVIEATRYRRDILIGSAESVGAVNSDSYIVEASPWQTFAYFSSASDAIFRIFSSIIGMPNSLRNTNAYTVANRCRLQNPRGNSSIRPPSLFSPIADIIKVETICCALKRPECKGYNHRVENVDPAMTIGLKASFGDVCGLR